MTSHVQLVAGVIKQSRNHVEFTQLTSSSWLQEALDAIESKSEVRTLVIDSSVRIIEPKINLPRLTKISLTHIKITHLSICTLTSLTQLTLNNCADLSDHLHKLGSLNELTHLNLDHNTLSNRGCKRLIPFFETAKKLDYLSLRSCTMWTGEVVRVMRYLPNITTLLLDDSLITDPDPSVDPFPINREVVNILATHKTLRKLSLKGLCLGDPILSFFQADLLMSRTLESLNIASNSFTIENVAIFIGHVRRHLIELDISFIEIGSGKSHFPILSALHNKSIKLQRLTMLSVGREDIHSKFLAQKLMDANPKFHIES